MEENKPLEFTLAQIIGRTHGPVDRMTNAIILRGLTGEEKALAQRLMMDAHRQYVVWWTLTQRRWQAKTRRPSKAVHHDSIEIREKYVRCAA